MSCLQLEFGIELPCPQCGVISKSVKVDFAEKEATVHFPCGHLSVQPILTLEPKSGLSPPQLLYVHFDLLAAKVAASNDKNLIEYHSTIRYRLDIAQYCLKLLLDNYDNGVAFAAGLTGFLVQSKAALDSLCQEINLYYRLGIGGRADYVVDTNDLFKNLSKLSRHNPSLSNYLSVQIDSSCKWFKEFKEFRDAEGTHRNRNPRNLILGKTHGIKILGKDVGPFCIQTMSRINQITEECHRLMI